MKQEELSQYELEEAERERERQKRLNEVGTELPCPFCGIPRVKRSTYIRCMREGLNWGKEDDLDRDPRGQDYQRMKAMRSSETAPDGGAQPAKSPSKAEKK